MSYFDNKNVSYYLAGGLSGICGVLLSHPFDTIKTNFQSGKPMKMQFNISTFKNLYKGITPPVIGVGIEKSIVFGTFETVKSMLNKHSEHFYTNTIAGAVSGLSASIIVTPYERIKILLQTNSLKHIPKNPKFYFQGLNATLTRETPGFAIYFSVYEYLKKKYYTDTNDQINSIASFSFGGLAGLISWIFIYPQDRIKTILQSEISNKLSFLQLTTEIYKKQGFMSFYNGFHYALMRAIPLHAGTFMTMELLKSNFNKST
ncbi:mitochondrial carrier protein [Catovirus CTV1]|uniref:Mitochondrial carrier protein n=1 Tax=Catovirus CTV1 TaxID=1977631 RepID=A0A1V0SAQ1_9VIRU|nr:mitochondrial carrier protein [Catovirus CTV1]